MTKTNETPELLPYVENLEIADAVTTVMREADPLFEKMGGSTRHYVRDLLLPMLHEKGLAVISAQPQQSPTSEALDLREVIHKEIMCYAALLTMEETRTLGEKLFQLINRQPSATDAPPVTDEKRAAALEWFNNIPFDSDLQVVKTIRAALREDTSQLVAALEMWETLWDGCSDKMISRRFDPATVKRIKATNAALTKHREAQQ